MIPLMILPGAHHVGCEHAHKPPNSVRLQQRALPHTAQLIVGGQTVERLVDAPDDDGVAALLAPQFRHSGETQQPLGLPEIAFMMAWSRPGLLLPAKIS